MIVFPTTLHGKTYVLTGLTTAADIEDEGRRMTNALQSPTFHKHLTETLGVRIWSLRDEQGRSLVSLSLRPDKTIQHAVGPRNCEPTAEQHEALAALAPIIGATYVYARDTNH